jgi:hypothetical protein
MRREAKEGEAIARQRGERRRSEGERRKEEGGRGLREPEEKGLKL